MRSLPSGACSFSALSSRFIARNSPGNRRFGRYLNTFRSTGSIAVTFSDDELFVSSMPSDNFVEALLLVSTLLAARFFTDRRDERLSPLL